MSDSPRDLPLIAVDTGGTFTDALLERPGRTPRCVKVLSSSALRARIVAVDSSRRSLSTVNSLSNLSNLSSLSNLSIVIIDVAELPPIPERFLPGMAIRCGAVFGRVVAQSSVPAGVRLEVALLGGERDVRARSGATSGGPVALEPGSLIDLHAPWPAPILAARLLLDTAFDADLPALAMRLGTTRGTNALLERALDETLLVTNAGLGDCLHIGDQRRDRLFDLAPRRRSPLYAAVIEASVRQDATGRIIEPLDEESLRRSARAMLESRGIRHAAVVLMHAWKEPGPEREVAAILRDAGFTTIVCSHECAGTAGYLARGMAAVVDAALSSAVGDFLQRVESELAPGSTLDVVSSIGALTAASDYRARESLLSGPAGGSAALLRIARDHRESLLIGVDMGGTSTDACRVADALPLREVTPIGGLSLAVPSVVIESVAAGGGSVCWLDDGALRVGPASARAEPGPACYGRGGPLTITDVDLLLGRVDSDRFAVPVDRDAADAALRTLLDAATVHGTSRSSVETLEALRAIADSAMADAVRAISAREGFDPAEHVMVAFGGAGGQHACAIAEQLGVSVILHPARAGLLSAEGILHTRREQSRTEGAAVPLSDAAIRETTQRALQFMSSKAGAQAPAIPMHLARVDLQVQWAGLAGAIELPFRSDADDIVGAARARFREIFGSPAPIGELDLAWVRVVIAEPANAGLGMVEVRESDATISEARGERRAQRMRSGGTWVDAQIVNRAALSRGHAIAAPAVVADQHATVIIDTGWSGAVLDDGSIRLERVSASALSVAAAPVAVSATRNAPAPPEVLAAALAAVAVEMGEQLRRTAISVNVRDRLDFSCGILDGTGRLVTNAPHVPVHLGALGPCVQSVSRVHSWVPGDVIVTNHPDFGGSHLPDVTVLMPLFESDGEPEDNSRATERREAPIAFLAARAHHAEIGGIRPGSMPPGATTLEEEGVIIPPTPVAVGGEIDLAPIRALLGSAPFPSRSIAVNLADISAAIAALRRGAEGIAALMTRHGRPAILGTMDDLRERSARRVIQAAAGLREGAIHRAEQRLDDGWPITVSIARRGERLTIDFTGSGGVHPGNFNAPLAVTRSAVMYALRLLVESHGSADDRSLPLNDGLLDPVELIVPHGFLNPPLGSRAPVAAGNTETSQRVVDALLLALGLAACSQGTMNNLVMGGDGWSFYETIAGGLGATARADGASGLHAHMTNTRITDPEILEQHFPLRLRQFAFRHGSGGDGRHHGGEGLIREIEFLAPAHLSFISQRRASAPEGVDGGDSGAVGIQRVIETDGSVTVLSGVFDRDAQRGERLIIETPGGGAWGARTDQRGQDLGAVPRPRRAD